MTKRRVEPIRSLEDPVEEIPEDPYRRRLILLGGAGALGFLALTARLWTLQIVGGGDYRERADNNRLRLSRLDPLRGIFYDRHRIRLVANRPTYGVAIVPADLPRPALPIYRRLGRILGMPVDAIQRLVERRATDAFTPISIRRPVDERTVAVIAERHVDLGGVQIALAPEREYLDGALTSHILGYVGWISAEQYDELKGDAALAYTPQDRIGHMGLEHVYERDLRGRPGDKRSEVDAGGREVRVLALNPAAPGKNVVLTIDLALQREITRILSENIEQYEVASCVALDPRNGQVLALVHLPAFDNNVFARGLSEEDLARLFKDPRNPMSNGALTQVWAPGSVFKVVTACAALQEGVITAADVVTCRGALIVPNQFSRGPAARFPCWFAHGPQDMVAALAGSCNVYFYHVGGGDASGEAPGLGIDRLQRWAEWFGLTEPTGIELPGEVSGFFPTQTWKRETFKEVWYKGDTYNAAIGQGHVTTTPLQMAGVAAALVNGGVLYRPQVVLELVDEKGEVARPDAPKAIRRLPIDPAHLDVVRAGLRAGMTIGKTPGGVAYTGTSWDSDLGRVATIGKTGTAEFGLPDADGKLATHGWFIGAAPYDRPTIALAVFVKRGRGAQDAARIARQVYTYHFGLAT